MMTLVEVPGSFEKAGGRLQEGEAGTGDAWQLLFSRGSMRMIW
jgi:hypothetical protein